MPINPKIADTVVLSRADVERQKEYGELAQVQAELTEVDNTKLDLEGDGQAAARAPVPAVDPVFSEFSGASHDDKTSFVRAILGDKPFSKTYTLFGVVAVKFNSRTGDATESVYQTLTDDSAGGKISTDNAALWQLWLDRYMLASTLVEIKQVGLAAKTYVDTGNLHDRVRVLLELAQPLFHAILGASRDFEALVSHLTENAQHPDFWPAGGSTLPSKHTPPAPSTSVKQAQATVGA